MTILRPKHDKLFKACMSNVLAAKELLSDYMETELQEILDLDSIRIEKDSFIGGFLQELIV